jgi:hypothetical protein
MRVEYVALIFLYIAESYFVWWTRTIHISYIITVIYNTDCQGKKNRRKEKGNKINKL